MTRYIKETHSIGGTVWGGVASSRLTLLLCTDCGVLVADMGVHDTFHDTLDRLADIAIEAEHWAGMNRPLGGHRPFEDL